MKYLILLFAFVLTLFSCDDGDSYANDDSCKIVATMVSGHGHEQVIPRTLFTSDDIAWFNPKSREIKFSTIQPSANAFPEYAKVEIDLDNQYLFTIVACISTAVNVAYDDLVLYYDNESSKYYLFDCYPIYWSPKTTEQNRNKRQKGWTSFINKLEQEGKIRVNE